MNRTEYIGRSKKFLATMILAAAVGGCTSGGDDASSSDLGPTGSACTGASCVSLGTSANYAVFANTGISTDAGASVITGNIGTGPGVTSTAITGFALTTPPTTFTTSTQVTGVVHAFDYDPPTPTTVGTASNDMGAAYTDAAGRTATSAATTNVGGGTLANLTLAPGVYEWGTSVNITTDLALSGTATDVWIFKVAGTLDLASGKSVTMSGALPQNVFWQVADVVTIGTGAHFEGIVLGQTAIIMTTGASINGRLLAQSAVTLDATTVAQP